MESDVLIFVSGDPASEKSRRWFREWLEEKGKVIFLGHKNLRDVISSLEVNDSTILAFIDCNSVVENSSWEAGISKAKSAPISVIPYDSIFGLSHDRTEEICDQCCPTKGPKKDWSHEDPELDLKNGIYFIRKDAFDNKESGKIPEVKIKIKGLMFHFQNEKNEKLKNQSVVWVYKRSPKKNGALRLSVKLAEINLGIPEEEFFVVGDHPGPWFKGTHVPCLPVTVKGVKRTYGTNMRKKWRKWVDSVHKLKRIIDTPEIRESFLWMYDDSFIVNPCSVDDFAVPSYSKNIRPKAKPCRNSWRECKRRTFEQLRKYGLPTLDYSTHHPIVYEKHKLKITLDEFNPFKHPSVIESLYCNHWFNRKTARKIGVALLYGSKLTELPKFNKSTLIWNIKNRHLQQCLHLVEQHIDNLNKK